MRWSRLLASFGFGFAVASVLFLSLNHNETLNRLSTEPGSQSIPAGAKKTDQDLHDNAGVPVRVEMPLSSQNDANAGSLRVMLPDLGSTSPVQKILMDSDPGTRGLFEAGVVRLQNGDFSEAAKDFQQVSVSHPDDKVGKLADWAIGFALYGLTKTPSGVLFFEGRPTSAADHWAKGLDFLSLEDGFGGLVETTLIDLASVHMNRWRSGNENIKVFFGRECANELRWFLNRAPNDPQAPAARAALEEILQALPSLR